MLCRLLVFDKNRNISTIPSTITTSVIVSRSGTKRMSSRIRCVTLADKAKMTPAKHELAGLNQSTVNVSHSIRQDQSCTEGATRTLEPRLDKRTQHRVHLRAILQMTTTGQTQCSFAAHRRRRINPEHIIHLSTLSLCGVDRTD